MERMDLFNEYADRYIDLGNLVTDISLPVAKGLLFMFAAFGMVEAAYDEPSPDDASFYDGLCYVRLTPLGRYCLGLDDKYEPKVVADDAPVFELDDERLMIKSLKVPNPFETLVCDFADRITPTLYKVSFESMLKGCNNIHDVERKIDTFRRFVCAKPTEPWLQFFNVLRKRSSPFTAPSAKYVLLSISPDDKDLQHLLLSDPQLRQLIKKVEGYMVLVDKDNVDKLSAALRKHGYLY